MAEDTGQGRGGTRGRTGLPPWVWLVTVLVAVLAALGSAWWVEQDTAVPDEPPGRPEEFCAAVTELRSGDEITVTVGEGSSGLQPTIDGLRRLLTTDAPDRIHRDVDELVAALEEVQAEADAVAPDDTSGLARVSGILDGRLRELREGSERIEAYTARWCTADGEPSPGG